MITETDFLRHEIPYFMAPDAIFESNLKANERLILLYLYKCANKLGIVFPSYQTIAAACGLSRPTVINTIKVLVEDHKLITKTAREDKSRPCGYTSNIYNLPSANQLSSQIALLKLSSNKCETNNNTFSGKNNLLGDRKEEGQEEMEGISSSFPSIFLEGTLTPETPPKNRKKDHIEGTKPYEVKLNSGNVSQINSKDLYDLFCDLYEKKYGIRYSMAANKLVEALAKVNKGLLLKQGPQISCELIYDFVENYESVATKDFPKPEFLSLINGWLVRKTHKNNETAYNSTSEVKSAEINLDNPSEETLKWIKSYTNIDTPDQVIYLTKIGKIPLATLKDIENWESAEEVYVIWRDWKNAGSQTSAD